MKGEKLHLSVDIRISVQNVIRDYVGLIKWLSSKLSLLTLGCWLVFSIRYKFPLLSESSSQLESYWLPQRYMYHYCTFRVVLSCWLLWWFIGIVAGQNYWFLPCVGILHGVFWNCQSQSSRRTLLGPIQLKSSGSFDKAYMM